MIDIPVYDIQGNKVDSLQVDEALLGGEVRHGLLKQAYVRIHANQRLGTSATKNRARTEGSTKKLYKQKHTGNARRGAIRTNIMKGGGRAHGKIPHSWRQDMPTKMRRLANRNAVLAKAVDSEIKLINDLSAFSKPSTKAFNNVLTALKIDRSCLFALASTLSPAAKSAANLDQITITRIDQINVFDLLNHRYLLTDKATFQTWIDLASKQVAVASETDSDIKEHA
jgi:large subunit ribosomal protein L4